MLFSLHGAWTAGLYFTVTAAMVYAAIQYYQGFSRLEKNFARGRISSQEFELRKKELKERYVFQNLLILGIFFVLIKLFGAHA